MGLFNFLKKKDNANNSPIDDNPFAETSNKQENIPISQPQKVESQEINDDSLKNAVNPPQPPEKTEFNLEQVKKDKEYLDDVMKNDLDLNSQEIEFAINAKVQEEEYDIKDPIIDPPKVEDFKEIEVHPELKKKIEAHDEEIHIDTISTNSEKSIFENYSPDKLLSKIEMPTAEDFENKKTYNLESPDGIKDESLELPEFYDTPSEIINSREEIRKIRKRKKINGDLFVKASLYREALHSNLKIKEDIKMCEDRAGSLTTIKNSQSKQRDRLKETLDSLQENLLFIEEKLFNNNQ